MPNWSEIAEELFAVFSGPLTLSEKKLIRISISFWCWIFTSTSSPARGRVCELQEISAFYQPFRSKETCHIHVPATLVNLCSVKAAGVCFCEVIDGEWFEFDVKGWSMSFHHELSKVNCYRVNNFFIETQCFDSVPLKIKLKG